MTHWTAAFCFLVITCGWASNPLPMHQKTSLVTPNTSRHNRSHASRAQNGDESGEGASITTNDFRFISSLLHLMFYCATSCNRPTSSGHPNSVRCSLSACVKSVKCTNLTHLWWKFYGDMHRNVFTNAALGIFNTATSPECQDIPNHRQPTVCSAACSG